MHNSVGPLFPANMSFFFFCTPADEDGVVCIFYGSIKADIVILDVLENQFVRALESEDFFSTAMVVAVLRLVGTYSLL